MKLRFEREQGNTLTVEALPGETLLDTARRCGVALDAPCAGNGSCGKCRVRLTQGHLQSAQSRHITPKERENGWYLACESTPLSDCTLFLPKTADSYRAGMRTAELLDSGLEFPVSCPFLAVGLQLTPPTKEDTLPDSERLSRALQRETGAERVIIPHAVMVKLSKTLREQSFSLCVKGRLEGNTFTCMTLGDLENTALIGAALDIGTTTVCMALWDLKSGGILAKGSQGNGQIRYGGDVIHRIVEQGKPGGVERLQNAVVRETINPLLDSLCRKAGCEPGDVLLLSVAANTVMNHLLVGAEAESIRTEPYIPSFFYWEDLRAGDLGLAMNPLAPVRIAPNTGAYVGGDITAGTLASGLWKREEMSLLVDLGTNGEIVFGNREFFVSCACSAGPAFEGGDIACGMRATEGAIDSCRLDRETLLPTMTVIGGEKQMPKGICGSGLIDIVSELLSCGAINGGGRFTRWGGRIHRDESGIGRYYLTDQIYLSEVDIGNLIRAKGAVYAAIDTLLAGLELPMESIDRVYIAGGIGSGIRVKNAIAIGLLPNLPIEKFRYIGNAALAGAYAIGKSQQAYDKCRELAANMTYVELSLHPGYMDAFVAACFLPHTNGALFAGIQE